MMATTQTKAAEKVSVFSAAVRRYVDAKKRIEELRGPESLDSIRRRLEKSYGAEADLLAERQRLLDDEATPEVIVKAYHRMTRIYSGGTVRRLLPPGGRFEQRLLGLYSLMPIREDLALALTSVKTTLARIYGSVMWALLRDQPDVFTTGDIEDPEAAQAEARDLEATLPALRAACVPSAEDWVLGEIIASDGRHLHAAFYRIASQKFSLGALDDLLLWCEQHPKEW